MNIKHTVITLLAAGIVPAFLAGCGKQDAAAAPVLRVGYQQGGSSTLPMIALNENYFDQTGIKTDFVLFTNSSDGLNALNAGKLDIGVSFGTGGPLTFISKGSKFVIIGGNLSGGHPIITKPEHADEFKSIEDFKGKTVGTPRIFTSDVVFRGALFEAGIDPEKDLTIVEFKRPVDVLEAVKSGKVDVGVGATNIIGQSVQAGLASPLWSNDLSPNHPCCRIVVTEEALQKYRPELVKFLKAELLAEKKFVDDPQSGVRADVEQQKFGEKLASDLVLNPHLQFSVDPNRKGVEAMWAHMKKIGYADGEPDFSKVIDTTLYNEALQELRKEQPNEPFWEKLEQRYKDQNL